MNTKYRGFQNVWWIVLIQGILMLLSSIFAIKLLNGILSENMQNLIVQTVIIIPILIGMIILKKSFPCYKLTHQLGFCSFEPDIMIYLIFLPIMAQCFISYAFAAPTLGLSEIFGEYDSGVLSPTTISDFLILFVMLSVAAPIFEELLFRGVIMSLLKPYGTTFAVLISALGFSLLHFQPVAFFPLFGLGVVLAVIRIFSGSIFPCMIFHSITNFYSLLAMVFMPQLTQNEITIAVLSIIMANLFPLFIFLLYRGFGKHKWEKSVISQKVGKSVALIFCLFIYIGLCSTMIKNIDLSEFDIPKNIYENEMPDRDSDSRDFLIPGNGKNSGENDDFDEFEDYFDDFFDEGQSSGGYYSK